MKRGRKINRICNNCENEFVALMIKVKQGGALYCCIDCYKQYRKKHLKDSKYLNRIYQKKHKYGLTELDYLNLFKIQNNQCGICEKSFNNVKACVDHSHKHGNIRGLLCNNCNKGLGLFKDNIELLLKAIKYLETSGI